MEENQALTQSSRLLLSQTGLLARIEQLHCHTQWWSNLVGFEAASNSRPLDSQRIYVSPSDLLPIKPFGSIL
jgi:hypothetical protein